MASRYEVGWMRAAMAAAAIVIAAVAGGCGDDGSGGSQPDLGDAAAAETSVGPDAEAGTAEAGPDTAVPEDGATDGEAPDADGDAASDADGDAAPDGADTDALVPALSVAASATETNASGATVELTASLVNSTEEISWTMAPQAGSLSATTGAAVTYTPPESIGTPTDVTFTASAAGLTASAVVRVNPGKAKTGLPLPSKKFNALSRLVEYMVLGPTSNGSNQHLIDAIAPFGKVNSGPVVLPPGTDVPTVEFLDTRAGPWGNTSLGAAVSKVAKAANLDDDYQEEIVAVTWPQSGVGTGTLRIIDPGSGGYGAVVPAGVSLVVGDQATDKSRYDLAVGDIDDDGYDEIVVLGTVTNGLDTWQSSGNRGVVDPRPGKLWILDDAEHGYALLHEVTLPGVLNYAQTPSGLLMAKVAVGGMTEDHKKQIVVVWNDMAAQQPTGTDSPPSTAAYRAVFNADGTPNGTVQQVLGVGLHSKEWQPGDDLNLFDIALLDYDGDKKDELVVADVHNEQDSAKCPSGCAPAIDLVVLDDLDAGLAIKPGLSTVRTSSYTWEAHRMPEDFAVVLDADGDGFEDLLVGPILYTGSVSKLNWRADIYYWDQYRNIADIQAGDVNGDHKGDVIALFDNGAIEAKGYLDQQNGTPAVLTTLDSHTLAGASNDTLGIVVPVNVDEDSIIVEYAGDPLQLSDPAHSLVFRDNKIVALLASPPVKDGIGQNIDGSSTAFGTSVSNTFTAGADLSARAGVVLGIEEGVSAGFLVNVEIFRISVEVEEQIEYTRSYTWSRTKTETLLYTATAGDDFVLFETTPYDRYSYEIITSPDKSAVGKMVYVDVPQPPATLFVTRDYYNANDADGLQITKDLLADTPFQLNTYLPKATVLARTSVDLGHNIVRPTTIELLDSSGPFSVSQSGSVTAMVDFENAVSVGNSLTLSVDAKAQIIAQGVSVGAKWGLSLGGYLENSTSKSTSFQGTVGGIPAAQYAANKYDWGMYTYKQTILDPDGAKMQEFFVINYWVQ
jgi:hypothetical protein